MEHPGAASSRDHRLRQPWGSLSGHRVPVVSPPPNPGMPELQHGVLASPNPAPAANPT